MITDIYDLEKDSEEIGKILAKEIRYLAEGKGLSAFKKFNIKFKIEEISPYN